MFHITSKISSNLLWSANFARIHSQLFSYSVNKQANKQTNGSENSIPPRVAEVDNTRDALVDAASKSCVK